MAVIENRVDAGGDVLIIRPDTPIVGLISLYQFVDTTVGESEIDYFKKEFRYSVDGGLTFSSWLDLTLINIQNVSITKFDQFVLEYRYTRVGSTPDVTLEFDDILVSGTFESLPYPVFGKSVFNDFFSVNNVHVFGWALNVLEKLYRKGLILPDYLERADNNSNLEDEDFIVFWNSITHFFAIIVYFARQFENFETNEIMLEEFLKNKDLAFSSGNDFSDLLYIYSNYIDEYKKRGTLKIIEKKTTGTIDGELLRLINYKTFEEFIFCFFQNYESGWCIGKSSPTWNNTEGIVNLNKGYEPTKEVVNLTNYPLLNSSYISLNSGYIVLDEVPADTVCGIANNGNNSFKIPVDNTQDYEISFRVKTEESLPILNFGVDGYKQDYSDADILDIRDLSVSKYFCSAFELKKVDTEYWVRAVLWNKNKLQDPDSLLNIGIGNSLKMTDDVSFIVPIVTVTPSIEVSTKTYIRDLKVRPLKLNFSRGQLGVHNIIYLLIKNNNGEFGDTKIKDYIANKLVPYNTFVKTKIL